VRCSGPGRSCLGLTVVLGSRVPSWFRPAAELGRSAPAFAISGGSLSLEPGGGPPPSPEPARCLPDRMLFSGLLTTAARPG
jgi:hypothetical protein